MGVTPERTAGRMKKLIGAQLAGPVLALMMVQRSAARGRAQKPE